MSKIEQRRSRAYHKTRGQESSKLNNASALLGKLHSVREAAEMLGVSVPTIRRWIIEDRITKVKVGGSVKIPLPAIEEIIQRGYSEAKAR